MEYQPPIESRETNDLLEIITSPEDWEPVAIEQARIELSSRGISVDEQMNREKAYKKFKKKSLFLKGNASYSKLELVLLTLFGPVIILLLQDFWIMSVDAEYKKKKRQGRIALSIGFALWAFTIYVIFK